MDIKIDIDGSKMLLSISGSITSNNVNEIENEILKKIYNMKKVVVDLKDVDYISSAGARLLLMLQKKMIKVKGQLIIENTTDFVYDVLKQTGFVDILDIR